LAARLQTVREEERTALSRELHDVLAQDLTRLKIDLAWLERRLIQSTSAAGPPPPAAKVAEMLQVADAAIASVQRIATGLRPAVLDSLGLCAAVEWQTKEFQSYSGVACQVSVPAETPAVGQDVATAMFRILQESLTNVARHARASRVEVSLRREVGQIVLRVEDNGWGIGPESLKSPLSIGLAGMRERALMLGGQFEILSDPGRGTTIEARMPAMPGGEATDLLP
jgi:signal transduction histidine kinase